MRTILASSILFLKERKMDKDKTANSGVACSCTHVGARFSRTPCMCVMHPIATVVPPPCEVPPSPENMDGDELASFAGAQE